MAARGPAPRIQTVTSTTLLEGLKDPANHTRWRDYVDRYRPLLVGFLRRHGVQATDAEDVAQNVLIEFVRGYCEGRYDRERGRLSSWLFGIAFRQLQNHRRRERGRARRADERLVEVEEVAPLLAHLPQFDGNPVAELPSSPVVARGAVVCGSRKSM